MCGCFRGVAFGPTSHVEQQADEEHRHDQRAATIADQRQRDALVRQHAGHDADVDDGLQSDQKCYPQSKQQAEGIARMRRDIHAANDDQHEGQHHEQGRD